jgi:hypothetical protein
MADLFIIVKCLVGDYIANVLAHIETAHRYVAIILLYYNFLSVSTLIMGKLQHINTLGDAG